MKTDAQGVWDRDGESVELSTDRSKPYQVIKVINLSLCNFQCMSLKDLPVTKQKDTTRSHPEHGRKDFSRRQYSEGSLPGR